MMPRQRILKVIGFCSLASVFGACTNNHQEWVGEANRRWLDVRGALLLDKAKHDFETGDLDQAEKSAREAISLDPDSVPFHVLAGRIALERGQLERSFHLLNIAIEHDEENAEAYYFQGVVLQRWQQYDDAYDHYSKSYEIDPDNVSYVLAIGEMLITLDRVDEALELLEGKLAYFDQNVALRSAVAHLYAMKEQPKRAADLFREAALLAPNDLRTQEELALAQLAARQLDDAVDTFRALFQEPKMKDRRDLRRALAQAYLELGREDDARQVYIDLARSERGEASDWIRVGELALQRDNLFAAMQAANRAIHKAPHQHEGYLLAGMIQHKRGRVNEALRMFDRAAECDPKGVVPLILRGIALQKAGRLPAAADAYGAALRRQPEDARAKRLLEGLASKLH